MLEIVGNIHHCDDSSADCDEHVGNCAPQGGTADGESTYVELHSCLCFIKQLLFC